MRYPVCLALCLLAAPALAETPMDGAGFEAAVTGQTIEFSAEGRSYGAEQYLPGRRVIWAFEGGPCRRGKWHERAPGQICFVYEHDPGPQCWTFFDEGGTLRARLSGAAPGQDLRESRRRRAPLACPGPEVGA